MKRLISAMLCVMMLVSLFTMNAQASVATSFNHVTMIENDFEGTVSEGYTFERTEEVSDENGNTYLINTYRAYAQPIDYPDSNAYTVEFDSKFCDLDGNVKNVQTYINDKNIMADLELDVSMDFTLYGSVTPEEKGIDPDKWYTFRITIDKAIGISKSSYYLRLYGNGIKVEWKEQGAGAWKTAVNGYNLDANSTVDENGNSALLTNYSGETLKYNVSYYSNSWQWTNPADYVSDGFGYSPNSYLDNFKIRELASPLFTDAKLAEDEDGYYVYSDGSARPYIQPVNFPESETYTIEFDSKFQSTVANEDGTYAVQPIVVYLLDPALREHINSTDLTSSIDFNIMGNIDSELKDIDPDKWYSFKITIDRSRGVSFSSYYFRINGSGLMLQYKERGAEEWKTAVNAVTTKDYTGESLKFFASINYWANVNKNDMETPGIGFQTRTYMDELKISYKEGLPAPGAIYYDDFEGATVFTGNLSSVAYENKNNYLALKADGTAWASSGTANLTNVPETFIITMDVYKGKDCKGPLVVEYTQNNVNEGGTWGQIGLNAADVEAEKWYRLKIAKIAADRKYIATVEDLATGEVKSVVPFAGATQIPSAFTPNNLVFRGWRNGGAVDWRVDNILMAESAEMELLRAQLKNDGTYSAAFALRAEELLTNASTLTMVIGDKAYATDLYGENSIINWADGYVYTEGENLMFAITIDGIGEEYITEQEGVLTPNFKLYVK